MIGWLIDNATNIVVILAVAALVTLAIWSMVKDRKAGKSSCGCGCANCAMAGKCHQQKKR
ncbi:Virus attachment protein p12 family protein [Ruminococcaceae bacterium YRB3002]|nr:Virus attachment protein p12 family protein [Ruminococcaceae bacterium YRB3002]